MNAIASAGKGGRTLGPIDIKVERVKAIGSTADHDAWQVVVDWFTSPYWHAPAHLTELLIESKPDLENGERADFRLAESPPSLAIREMAAREVGFDPVDFSLVDLFVFGDTDPRGANRLAESIGRNDVDAVVIELDSGHVVSASLTAVMAWITAESIRHGFSEEVTHGHRSLMCDFIVTGDPSGSDGGATAMSLALLMPLPCGIAERSNAGGCDLAVPLPAYPLMAMVLPEHSAAMFPTFDPLSVLLGDPSPDRRRGRLEPLGKFDVWWAEAKLSLIAPLTRPASALAGMVARGLARSRDRVAASRLGPVLVPSGVTLGWVWSLLRSASSAGRNPWLTGAGRSQLDQTAVMEVRR